MTFPTILGLLPSIGTPEILFILLLILLLFGAQKIPDLARSLGRAQKEFTKARQELEETPATTDEDRVRKAARDLGIHVEGKTVDELRKEISLKMQ